MDSDDVAMPNRFEKQIKYLEDNPDCDIVGGQITEFIGSENNIVGKRTVPCTHSEIIHYLKSRCPFNHMTVAFKKMQYYLPVVISPGTIMRIIFFGFEWP